MHQPTLQALADSYHAALLQDGATARHASKQRYTVLRAGTAPSAFLDGNAARWTAATLADTRNRLSCFAVWLRKQPEGASHASLYDALPRPKAGRVAVDRASFTAEEIGRLLASQRVPAHRRAFYRCIATLGLRPVEVSRIEACHVVREGAGFVLRLPGASQKSGRADVLHLEAWQAQEILDNLPLVRQDLQHFGETFHLDLSRCRIDAKQGRATRRLYDLRSFMISHLLREGVDLETVRQLARHRNIETTISHYTRHREGHAGEVRAEIFKSMRPKKVKAEAATA